MFDFSIAKIIVNSFSFFYVVAVALMVFFLAKTLRIYFNKKTKISLKCFYAGLIFLVFYSFIRSIISYGFNVPRYETALIANFFLCLAGIAIFKSINKLSNCCLRESNAS